MADHDLILSRSSNRKIFDLPIVMETFFPPRIKLDILVKSKRFFFFRYNSKNIFIQCLILGYRCRNRYIFLILLSVNCHGKNKPHDFFFPLGNFICLGTRNLYSCEWNKKYTWKRFD